MTTDHVQTVEEIVLDLDTLITLRDNRATPHVRGWLAANRIERFVREKFQVRNAL